MRSKGVGAATTRTIAAEAGISEALVDRYFKSKRDVLRTAVREYVGFAFAETLQTLAEHVGRASPAENLERVAAAALTYYHDLIPLLASLFSDNALIVRDRCDTAGLPCINWTGGEQTRSEWMFQYQVGSLEEEPGVLALHLIEHGVRRIALVGDDVFIGLRYREFFLTAAARSGPSINSSPKRVR